jgi:hypothetical protein
MAFAVCLIWFGWFFGIVTGHALDREIPKVTVVLLLISIGLMLAGTWLVTP